ncbi:MAG: anhydro-N-acetylmuramic acid kinase [Flavobacteriales bacterium]
MKDLREATRIVGVMSGSSLDGIDLALCSFKAEDGHWAFTLEKAATVPYSTALRDRLLHATQASAVELTRLHRDIGTAIGNACDDLLQGSSADAIASHGHTLFHQPDEGLTFQAGSGAHIAAITGLPTVCDFRTMDVALGGQGAPLVPLGEQVLFPGQKAFLNLGGIANIALHGGEKPIGYDVCPCNQVLDGLAQEAGSAFDTNGDLARTGTVDTALLARLDALPFYTSPPPRSLGREWFEDNIKPLLAATIPLADRMRTGVEHIAGLVAKELDASGAETVLVTGGGAHNGFLVERIAALSTVRPELPSKELIDYKEAVIFAVLGLLRLRGEHNTLASVTGAARGSIGGAVYLPY